MKKRDRRRFWWRLIILAVLVAVGLTAYFLFLEKEGEERKTEEKKIEERKENDR